VLAVFYLGKIKQKGDNEEGLSVLAQPAKQGIIVRNYNISILKSKEILKGF
jgi:hypothetical protein